MATANVRFTADTTDFQRGVRQINDNVSSIRSSIGALGGALAAIGVANVASAFARMGSDILKSSSNMAASFETLQVQLEVLTGSADKAGNLIKQISEYGAATPFDQAAIQGAVKTLLTFGVATEDVMDVVAQIGDVSMGSADKLASLARVFGQVSSAGVMMGEDVNQMIDAGFNPLIEISNRTGESVSALKQKASDGMLGINDLKGAFTSATGEGGKYQGMLERISSTTEGKMSNFGDNIDQLKIALGTGFNVGLNDVLDKLNTLTPEFKSDVESIGVALGDVVKIFADKLPGTLDAFKEMVADKGVWSASLEIFKKGLVEVLSSPEIKEAFTDVGSAIVPEDVKTGASMAVGFTTAAAASVLLQKLYGVGKGLVTATKGMTAGATASSVIGKVAGRMLGSNTLGNLVGKVPIPVLITAAAAGGGAILENEFGVVSGFGKGVVSAVTGRKTSDTLMKEYEAMRTKRLGAEIKSEETATAVVKEKEKEKKTVLSRFADGSFMKEFKEAFAAGLPKLDTKEFKKFILPPAKEKEAIEAFQFQGFRGFQSEMAAVGGASFFTKGQTAENNLRITNQYLAKIERNTKGLIKLEPSWS